VAGVKILTYNGPIYYGNRSFFKEEVSRLLGLTPERIRSLEKTRKALEKRQRDTTVSTVVRLAAGLLSVCPEVGLLSVQALSTSSRRPALQAWSSTAVMY
jgi:hypothetical protein